jgi:hypothetical protein
MFSRVSQPAKPAAVPAEATVAPQAPSNQLEGMQVGGLDFLSS